MVSSQGYFIIADDAVFNFWHPLDLSVTVHEGKIRNFGRKGWYSDKYGMVRNVERQISLREL